MLFKIQAPPGSDSGYSGSSGSVISSVGTPPATAANNLPAILQSSLGKLEMNFVQNKTLEGAMMGEHNHASIDMAREVDTVGGMKTLEGPGALDMLVNSKSKCSLLI